MITAIYLSSGFEKNVRYMKNITAPYWRLNPREAKGHLHFQYEHGSNRQFIAFMLNVRVKTAVIIFNKDLICSSIAVIIY